jgi:putative Holliday junction resolvase
MNNPEGRILALDLGSERVGVAVSDPLGITAQPLPTLNRRPERDFQAHLGELIESLCVLRVIVGLPRGLSGGQGTHQKAIESSVASYRQAWPEVEWVFWDERFTTTAAARALQGAPQKTKRRKGLRDQIAAQLILQGYLQSLAP